jgi:hypothetical protein
MVGGSLRVLRLLPLLKLVAMIYRGWEEFFVKETMAPYLTTSRGDFRE